MKLSDELFTSLIDSQWKNINNSFIHFILLKVGRFVEKSGCISNVQSHRSMFVGKSDCVFSEMVFEEIYSLIQINPIQKK